MPLINKISFILLDFLFITRLRPLFIRYKKEVNKHFDQPLLRQTYWTECAPENFAPPGQVKFSDCNQIEVNSCAKDLMNNWQVLSNSLMNELVPLVKRLVLYGKFWPKKKRSKVSSHGVSDHIYEM